MIFMLQGNPICFLQFGKERTATTSIGHAPPTLLNQWAYRTVIANGRQGAEHNSPVPTLPAGCKRGPATYSHGFNHYRLPPPGGKEEGALMNGNRISPEWQAGVLYLATKGSVAAVDKNDGRILWETSLASGVFGPSGFVTLLVDGDRIFAHVRGELFCLDAALGRILWKNPLSGWGYEIASLATATAGTAPGPEDMAYLEEERRRRSSMH